MSFYTMAGKTLEVLGMTVGFVDVMVFDSNTAAFLWMLFPKVRTIVLAALVLSVPLAIVIWRFDPFRVRRAIHERDRAGNQQRAIVGWPLIRQHAINGLAFGFGVVDVIVIRQAGD